MGKHRTNRNSLKEAGVPGEDPARRTLLEVVVGAAESLYQLSISTGQQVLEALLEDDRIALCGPRGRHDSKRSAVRHGHDDGVVVVGGRKVKVRKPRVRTMDGQELALPTYEQFSSEDPLLSRVYEQMVVGVSTRKYNRSLETLPVGLDSKATSKSEVSRNFVARTQAQLTEFLNRPLDELDIVAVMIDGVHVSDHVLLVALGIDATGYKHVLGLWEGTSEQTSTCRGLLRSLVERGLDVERPRLFVIDGAKGLRQAIKSVFGAWAVLARCRQHKLANILGHLPENRKAWVRTQIRRAYDSKTAASATARLHKLAGSLEVSHPSAAASIMEGLDETLTVLALGIGTTLARTLRTTNPIENMNGAFRQITKRVKRWRGGKMVLRWGATALTEAEGKFHRIKGYRDMPQLAAALEAMCTKRGRTLDKSEKIA